MPLYPSGTVTVETTYGFSEDSAHVSGDSGAFILAVRNDAGIALAADGDYIPFTTDSSGALRVAASVAINYAYPEDSPHTTGNIGSFVLAVRNDSGIPLAADGDYIPFTTNAAGELRVTTAGGTPTGRDDTDNQAPVATGLNTVVSRAYVFDGANWDRWDRSITDGGGSLTVDGTVAVTQSTSPWVTSLDAASLSALESITVQNGAGAAAVNIQDGGNSITVDGAVTVSGTITTAYQFAEDSAHTTGNTGAFVLAVRNTALNNLTDTDGDYSPIAVDQLGRVMITNGTGELAVNINVDFNEDQPHTTGDNGAFVLGVRNDAGATLTTTNGDYSAFATDAAGRIGIADLGGSVTVDGTVEIGATSLAALESITVQNGSGAAAVNIQDGGNSITVDGTVSISGTVTVDTNYDFAEDAAHASGDIGVQVLAVRNDTPGTLVTTNGDYASFQQDGAGGLRVAGTVRHDDAITTATHSPIVTAARAQDDNTTITSVAAGDAVFRLADLKGVQFIKEQRPQLLGIYYGIFGPSQLTNAADGATAGRMWLLNTSATIAAAVRIISFESIIGSTTAMLTFPRITVERMTFTGTPTGASITPALRSSTDAANTATIRTASTGITPTAGAGIHNFIPAVSLTGVGAIIVPEQKLDLSAHSDARVILGQNQGIVIRQADGGTASDSRRFFISISWEEYTV